MPGVKQLFNRLERHHSPDNVPALQGTIGHKVGPRFAFMQAHWSPTAQIAAAAVGMAALLYSLKRRTAGAATLGVSGLALLVRTATNAEFSRIFNLAEHYFEKAA